ncbi:GNAT family N-acetyltransferase [Flavobacteriaceae bacterium S0825]|uniref:GNAT family N-acetyltransferase n=1 Tax=Gaetbulibacter sp. S0825 TaxID=2720084 RepID=UPI00142F7B94|nr:GNAT family N-acetyltransferase [Gaetbulibacter sp. S0825]MCK0107905.1 GNAT family N-acetyltransferase [Flavobacteriaceae bacterium S0825]NIX63541.1 GNAT family N-acetyltransferase [Gaetbulibacter sp. S0825]
MIIIRKASQKDAKALLGLIKGLAIYEGQLQYLKTDLDQITESGFSNVQPQKFEAIIAEHKGVLIGYVTYMWNYSIWNGSTYMAIDDLFVCKPFRGNNIGQKLMQHAKDICVSNNIKLIKWEVESNNEKAIRFYKKLGAQIHNKSIVKWHTT